MTERYGSDFRLWLCSAERLSDAATFFGLPFLKTPSFKVSASR